MSDRKLELTHGEWVSDEKEARNVSELSEATHRAMKAEYDCKQLQAKLDAVEKFNDEYCKRNRVFAAEWKERRSE